MKELYLDEIIEYEEASTFNKNSNGIIFGFFFRYLDQRLQILTFDFPIFQEWRILFES